MIGDILERGKGIKMGVIVKERDKGSGVYWIFINHNGKRKKKKIGTDKKIAEKVAKQIEARLVLGDMGIIEDNKDVPLFKDYASQWLDYHIKVKCKSTTADDYKNILNNKILPEWGNIPIEEINRFKIKNFIMKKMSNNEISEHYARKIKTIIGDILNLAVDDGLINANPTHRMGNIYGKNKLLEETGSIKKIDFLTKEELSLLLKAFQKYFPSHYPFMLTLARTGMRLGEASALKWSDIDFNGRFVTIQRSFSSGKVLSSPKNGKSRRVDMSLQLTENLWKLKHDRIRELGDDIPEWVFPNENDNLMNSGNFRSRVFKKALEKAELRHIRIHDIRHTFASILLQAGESMMYVKEQLGHSSIRLTVDVYGHLIPGGNRDAVDKLDDSSLVDCISLQPGAPGVRFNA